MSGEGDADDVETRDRLAEAIERADERGPEFWAELKSEATDSFDRGLEWSLEIRDKSLEMMKVTLLLGSFYIGVFRFGTGEAVTVNPYRSWVPFALLFVSLLCFIYSYMVVGAQTLGPNLANVERDIEADGDRAAYLRRTAVRYFSWGHRNIVRRHQASAAISIGIGVMFASLGIFAYTMAFR